MTRKEVLEELEKMTSEERLEVIETAVRLLHNDLRNSSASHSRLERKRRLAAAAEALRDDYAAGGELTAFTALDAEDFHDP